MKHQLAKFLLLVILTSLLTQCSEKKANEKILGEWASVDKRISIIFDETNHAVFMMDGKVFGGNDFITSDGIKGEVKYEINETQKPSTLDIIIYEKGKTDERARIMGIFRYLTDNKIEWRMNFEGKRFEGFNSEDTDYTALLERIATK